MPNPDPKQKSPKKPMSHTDYSQKLAEQQANKKYNSFAGTEHYLYFGYQPRTGGKSRKKSKTKNKRKRKTYKRKCK